MNNLSNTVFNTYISRFEELPLDKQFHFASRLVAWSGDAKAKHKLELLRSRLISEDGEYATLSAIYSGQVIPLLPGNPDLLKAREPYIKQYPQLRDISRIMYWSAMLSNAYGLKNKEALTTLIGGEELDALYDDLLNDREAIALLSTHAVNYLYLYKRYYKDEPGPDPHIFGSSAKNDDSYYDFSDPAHLRLAVYMLTHALIADTVFYFETAPHEHILQHRQNMLHAEALIAPRMDAFSLDAKLEFLVCCKLIDYSSKLEFAIMQEAESYSEGRATYIIDSGALTETHNGFEKSEHRSSLYILLNSTSR